MRIVRLLPFAAVLLAGCGAAPDQASSSSASTEEDLSAKAPIPFVLQYVGAYEGDGTGRVESLTMDRKGKLSIRVDGVTHTGRFYGPTHVSANGEVVKLNLVTPGGHWTALIDADAPWQEHDTIDVTIDGRIERLTGTWPSGRESMCDATGGSWTDDDADPATGLFCLCGAHRSWIPSLGGCVR